MSRRRLPNRRVNRTDSIRWPPPPEHGAKRIHITAGFDHDGRLCEVFLRGGSKVGSERDSLYDDLAVVLSRLLQHGDTLKNISAGLCGRAEPTEDNAKGHPATVIGAVVDCLMAMQEQYLHEPREHLVATNVLPVGIVVESGRADEGHRPAPGREQERRGGEGAPTGA